jgi:hypothetical protein
VQNDRDNPRAEAWRRDAEPSLRKAAAQCHREAQDIVDSWYDKASAEQRRRNQTLIKARRGDAFAQARLGREYIGGIDGPLSDINSYAWISIALERGSEEAESLQGWQAVLADRMSSIQMAEAKALTAALRLSLCVD